MTILGPEKPKFEMSPEKLGIQIPVGPLIVKAAFPGRPVDPDDSGKKAIIDAADRIHGQWLTSQLGGKNGRMHAVIGPDGRASGLVINLGNESPEILLETKYVETLKVDHHDVEFSNLPKAATASLISRRGFWEGLLYPLTPLSSYREYYILLSMLSSDWGIISTQINPDTLISGANNRRFGAWHKFLGANWTLSGVPFI